MITTANNLTSKEPITFVSVTTPWLDRLKKLLPKVIPYVDRCVLIVGRRDPEAEAYLDSLGPKVEWYYHKWEDNFQKQWNNYLQYIKSGWVLLCDDDEIPSDSLLSSLRNLVGMSQEGNKFCCVSFRSNPISEGQDMGPQEYWREIFFRYQPGMFYQGGTKTGCHQYLVGYQNGNVARSNEVYYHVKSLKEEYRNAARNYYIYGIWKHGSKDGEQFEDWHELHKIVKKVYPEVETFTDLNEYLIKGNVHPELKDWMQRRYKEFEETSDYNELRAFYKYYYVHLHPEELEG